MIALANQSIAVTNQAYINSGVNLALELAYAEETTLSEAGVDMSTLLSRIRSNGDGFGDDVHTIRNQVMADFVSLFTSRDMGGYCGIASLMSSVSTSFAPSAFSVVGRNCATGNLSFPHELGHNMGSHHDRANAGSTPAYSYSYGRQFPPESPLYRTIMSYGGMTRVPYFSSPNVSYGGYATGTSTENNALSLNNVASTVVRFRDEAGPVIDSTAPSATLTSPGAGTQVGGTLAIAASATDNVGVARVEFRVNGSLIASDSSAPYGVSWNSNSVANGAVSVSAVAYDAAGNASPASQVSVNLANVADTTAPVARITSPANGAVVSGRVQVNCSASDNIGVTQMSLVIDGKTVASSTSSSISYRWSVSRKLASGPHSIGCQASDAAGNVGTNSISVIK